MVLICADYAICHESHDHRLADFNSTVTLIPWLQLSRYCMCHSPISCESGHFCFAAVSDPKGPSVLVSRWWQYSTLLTSYISIKHPCKLHILWSYSLAYYKGFYFRCYCTCKTQPRTQGFLKRSHDLIIKRVYRYNNHRYILLLGKINFSQNWASYTMFTIQYINMTIYWFSKIKSYWVLASYMCDGCIYGCVCNVCMLTSLMLWDVHK